MPRSRRLPPLLLLLALFGGGAAQAQTGGEAVPSPPWSPPQWVGDVTFLSANALLGGLSAGVLQHLRGGSFQDGFARGAAGGAVAYAGRRISAEPFGGAGLLGRQVSAAGVATIRNASEGRPALERLLVPIGPLNVYRVRGGPVRVKVQVGTVAAMAAMALRPEVELDAGASLSAGAPVFRAPRHRILHDGRGAAGYEVLGVILLGGGLDPDRDREVFAHERVHVLQHDFLHHAWGDPLEGWLLGRLPGGPALYRHLDLGVAAGGAYHLLLRGLDVRYENHPHEIEAHFLGSRR